MASRNAVTVSTVSDDSSSYSSTSTTTAGPGSGSVVMVDKEEHFEDEIMVHLGRGGGTGAGIENDRVSMASTICSSMEMGQDVEDPLQRHVSVGGASMEEEDEQQPPSLFPSPSTVNANCTEVPDPFEDEIMTSNENAVPINNPNIDWRASASRAFTSMFVGVTGGGNSSSNKNPTVVDHKATSNNTKTVVFDPLLQEEAPSNSNDVLYESFEDEHPMESTNKTKGGGRGVGTPAFGMLATAVTSPSSTVGSAPHHSYRNDEETTRGNDFAMVVQNNNEYEDVTDHHDGEDGIFKIEKEDDSNEPDQFQDEIDSQGKSNNQTKRKIKKNKKVKKSQSKENGVTKKKKENKSKKDSKITKITYMEGDEDDEEQLVVSKESFTDRFHDEDDEDGSHVERKATSTRAPPKGHDHDLEEALTAASSLAKVFTQGSENHKRNVDFVLNDDELEDYKIAENLNDGEDDVDVNNGHWSRDGVLVLKRKSKEISRTPTLRESFQSVFSSLQATPKSSPSQEAWQDNDAFHDELIVFDDHKKQSRDPFSTRGEESLNSDEEESLFVKSLSVRDGKTNYRAGLMFGKKSRCMWCVIVLVVLLFIALIIPLALLAQDNREYKKAQEEQQLDTAMPTGTTTDVFYPDPNVLPMATDAPTMAPSCVDEIRLIQNKTCFTANEPVEFTFTQCSPGMLDWIALYPENSVLYGRLWRDFINWIWTCGNLPCSETQVSENLPLQGTFSAPATKPGIYQLFIVLDSRWPYRYLVNSELFTIAEDTCEEE